MAGMAAAAERVARRKRQPGKSADLGYILWRSVRQRRAFLRMDDVAAQFGAILRDLRTGSGLSQEELAFRAGMSVPYLSDLERGRSNPSLAMVVDLARALGVHPVRLVEELVIDDRVDPPRRKRPKE